MRDATRLVQSRQILQACPEEDKPGNRYVTGDKHALAARPGVCCTRSPESGRRAQGAC
jgi:hypothetical protein